MDLINDNILIALDTIKETYISLKDCIKVKDKEIQALEQRNKELMNVLESYSQERNGIVEDDVDVTPDKLNIAMNNDSNLSFNDVKQQDQMLSADIFETENIRVEPLRSFRKPKKKMRKDLVDAENIEPKKGVVKNNRSKWLQKEMHENSKESFLGALEDKKLICIQDCIKQPIENRDNQKKDSSLNSGKKLKQARLTNYSIHRNSVIKHNFSSFLKDLPSYRAEATNAGITSVTRKGNELVADENKVQRHQAQNFEEAESELFDFTEKAYERRNKKLSNANLEVSSKTVQLSNQNAKHFYSNSPSIIIISPPKPETVFIEESYQDSTCIESMDLLKEVLKSGNETLNNLKRVESAKIKQLQKCAKMSITKDTRNRLESTNFIVHEHPISEIKKEQRIEEKTKEESISKMEVVERNLFDESSSSETDDFMPQPILVKKEKQIERERVKPQDDKGINAEFRRNLFNKSPEFDVPPTPDGFWDPLIRSFDLDDTRNQTLIDTRFQKKQLD